MQATNQRWLIYRRHHDELKGVVSFNGPVDNVVKVLQKQWASRGVPTGMSFRVEAGGLVDALTTSANF